MLNIKICAYFFSISVFNLAIVIGMLIVSFLFLFFNFFRLHFLLYLRLDSHYVKKLQKTLFGIVRADSLPVFMGTLSSSPPVVTFTAELIFLPK